MNNSKFVAENKKSVIVTLTGIIVMILLTVTKVVPSSTIAGIAVFVGIAFFFITEAVAKTHGAESGLRFNTIPSDLKKPGVIILMLLPIVTVTATCLIGNLIFSGEYVTHVMGRTSAMLSLDKIASLIVQLIIAAFGEEIAFRGFFFGKTEKMFPSLLCAVVSSVVFAAGHIAAGNAGIVAFDIATIFIDSMIYSAVYHKTENCLISTFSHILSNAWALTFMSIFFV